MKLGDLSDTELLDGLKSLCGQDRAVLARLLAHLVEVEKRRLHLEAACPSMLQFCVRRLGMSEDEACRRIHAARLARRFPDLLVRIERGDLTLSTTANLLYAEQTFGKEHVERKIRERRDPRQRGSASESCDLAASGLVNMGFRRAEVQRALDRVSARHRTEELSAIPVQIILREALAVLT